MTLGGRGDGLRSERAVALTSPYAAHPPSRLTKGAVGEMLVGSQSMSWLAKLPLWRGVLVLAYHRMHDGGGETPFDPGVFSATPSTLDAQMRFITRNFQVVSPE